MRAYLFFVVVVVVKIPVCLGGSIGASGWRSADPDRADDRRFTTD
jgi:hypothetical protein